MAIKFCVDANPPEALLAELVSLSPTNPFYTPKYVAAIQSTGCKPIVFTLRTSTALLSGCTAFLRRGRLSKSLEIISLPALIDSQDFWDGLIDFCRRTKVSWLEIGTFGSSPSEIPSLPGEIARQQRCEYVLDLTKDNLWDHLSSNHRRNQKKAEAAGVLIRQVSDAQSCSQHAELIALSMRRRKFRGEKVSEGVSHQEFLAFTKSGAGELFQSVLNGKLLSSLMILMSDRGAYYQSAGTSPEGMAIGASPFLVKKVAELLKERSIELFNLGGASEDNPGLFRFKSGFGATAINLESVSCYLGSNTKKKLGTAYNLLRNNPTGFANELLRLEQLYVYSVDPATVTGPTELKGAELIKLSDEVLNSFSDKHEAIAEQAERFKRLGFNEAYGVYYNGELAHISWMITHDRDSSGSFLSLKAGEAEITHCVTLPQFRGLGIYPFAIRKLCQIAAAKSIKKVFMITNVSNVSSQRGILRAGLALTGKIIRANVPSPSGRIPLTYRPHRWFRS